MIRANVVVEDCSARNSCSAAKSQPYVRRYSEIVAEMSAARGRRHVGRRRLVRLRSLAQDSRTSRDGGLHAKLGRSR